RLWSAQHLDRKSSQPPCELRHRGRCFQPPSRRFLVGSPPMAVSVGTIEHEEMVPGPDETPIHVLGEDPASAGRDLALFRLLSLWLGWLLLAWRNPDALLPAHAMLRE